MFSYRALLLYGVVLFITHSNAQVTIPFNFNTLFHAQELPLKKMHALSMEVWGMIDSGVDDTLASSLLKEPHICLLSRIMMIQSMFDMLVVQLSHIMNDEPDRYDHVLSELEHLSEVLTDAHKSYQKVVSADNTYTYAITHVLEVILQKINFLLHTRLAISPYYAFSRSYYPKAITPLSVPAYKLPVAPIS